MKYAPVTPHVCAVVVTYIPDIHVLRELLMALSPQVACVQIVDNSPRSDIRVPALLNELNLDNTYLLRLGDNLGIARALNDGVKAAVAMGASHFLLCDQDSLPASDMVAGLLRAQAELLSQGVRLGAIGPTFTDAHTGMTFPFQVEVPGNVFYSHKCSSSEDYLVDSLTLITSGCLIPVEAWASVGPMREDFFIDYVDIEWSYRARAAGFKLFGTAWASMLHRMGDAQLRVWFFGWRKESAYSPLRVYYRVRNFIGLCKSDFMPLRWKVRNGWYTMGVVYTQAIFGRARLSSLLMAVRGIRDGVRGLMGRYPENQFMRGKP